MQNALSRSEENFVEELLTWDDSRRSSEWLLCNVALVIGGCAMVGTSVFAFFHLTDQSIAGVLVPGFALGLFLVGTYVLSGRRIRERHQLAMIIRKMKGVGVR